MGMRDVPCKPLSGLLQPNAFDQAREVEFMQAMERAYFFFGDDFVPLPRTTVVGDYGCS
jgi:hypothetical protein